MNLTSWDLSYPTQAAVMVQTIFTGFLIGSLVVVNCIYKPWLKRIKDEEIPDKYEDKYNFIDYSDDENENETNENNIINDATPDGNVFMKYNEEEEGFEYWCDDKNIKYDYLDTVARKYCLSFNCCEIYEDRKKNIELQKTKEKEEEKEVEEKEVEEKEVEEKEESIFVKSKKIDTKKNDRSKGEVALKSNKYIYKGKIFECKVFLKTREDEIERKTKNKISYNTWLSRR
jgi:hypothetical protein